MVFRYLPLGILLGAVQLGVLLAVDSPLAAETRSVLDPRSRNDAPYLRPAVGFFSRGAAQTTFNERVTWTEKPQLEYFPAVHPKVQEAEETPAADSVQDPKAKKFLPTSEAILKEYGDPATDIPVLAQPDAPTPYKGLMAALQLNDEKLAFQYARQWARYLSNLNSRTLKVTGLTGLAMKREGQLEDGTWIDDPQFSQYRRLLEDDLKNSKATEGKAAAKLSLDGAARELLERARDEQELSPKQPAEKFTALSNSHDDEVLERRNVRSELGSSVPVDPQGKVSIFFFLGMRDNESLAMAPAIEALYRAVAKDAAVTFSAISLENAPDEQIKRFHLVTNTTFPILQADLMAQVFKISKTPSSVFLTDTTNRAVIHQGAKSFYFLDELLKAMRGRR